MNLAELVDKTASGPNSSTEELIKSLDGLKIERPDVNWGSLLGASIGLAAESGEFSELVKKSVFQGALFDKVHAKKELGDILWYLGLACAALGIDFDDVLKTNIEKLMKRYKNGFSVEESNNRKKDDI